LFYIALLPFSTYILQKIYNNDLMFIKKDSFLIISLIDGESKVDRATRFFCTHAKCLNRFL